MQTGDGLGSTPAAPSAEAGTLAASLIGRPTSFVNVDVLLDSEPIIGSFIVDGLTFAAIGESTVKLVGVSETEASGSTPAASEAEADDAVFMLPESVAYEGADYTLASVGAYAFYLSGVAAVELPASITDVDDRAFRSSDVSSVEVTEDNPSYASFDGILYDVDLTRLLLIPGGRTDAARISSKAEEVDAVAFSHCAGVTAISVDAGSDHLSSWDGLLYDADGTTLLRVPAGATDITIREGCTTIAAGAMEGCASLVSINAPATVTSISPDVFTSVPTVSLPAVSAVADSALGVADGAEGADGADGLAPEDPDPANAQLTALVALSATDDELPEIDCSRITVQVMREGSADEWRRMGFAIATVEASRFSDEGDGPDGPVMEDSLQSAETYGADVNTFTISNCLEQDSTDQFYYIRIGELSTTGNSILLDSAGGSNNFNNMKFGSDKESQWQMYNTPYGMALIRSDGKGFLLSMTPFNSSYPTLFTSASTFLSYYTPWECAYYVKTDNTVVKQPANYQSFYWHEVSKVCVTPGPSILETYHCNDGTGKTYERWIARGYYWPKSLSVSRPGYTSQGWWTGATSGSKYCDMGASSPSGYYENVTARTTRNYYARWSANTITCAWNSSGGSDIRDTSATYSDTAQVPMPTVDPVKAGYDFAGWYTKSIGGDKVSADTKLPTSNVTYYAHWNAKTITLKWDTKGAGAIDNTEKQYSSTAKVPMPAADPKKAGYAFAGWYTAGGVKVTSATALPTEDTTYEAHWTKNAVHAITLKMNAGNTTEAYKTVYLWYGKGWYGIKDPDIATAALTTIGVPERTGFSYAGFAREADAASAAYWTSVTSFPSNTAFSSDTVLYAVWSTNVYTITLDSKDADAATKGTPKIYIKHGTHFGYEDAACTKALPLDASRRFSVIEQPKRTAYTFRGYYTADNNMYINADGLLVAGESRFTQDMTLYARWSFNQWTITLDDQGADTAGSGAVHVRYDPWDNKFYADAECTQLITAVKIPVKSGWTFMGYYTEEDGGERYINADGTARAGTGNYTSDTTLYARWVQNGTLTFCSAEDPSSREAFQWLSASGSTITGSAGNSAFTRSSNAIWPVERTAIGFKVREKMYMSVEPYSSKPSPSDYTIYDIAYYELPDGTTVEQPPVGWKWEAVDGTLSAYVTPGAPCKVTWDANGGLLDAVPSWVGAGRSCTSPVPRREGYICTGWWTERNGGQRIAKVGEETSPISASMTCYARWESNLSVDVPIEVDISVDVLGIDEQVPASGVIKSRCAEPITVAEIGFGALAGAEGMFGADKARTRLEVLAESGSSPEASFPLDGSVDRASVASLQAFRIERFGASVPVYYRFAIPDDVLAELSETADPAPICSLTYVVALAGS